MENLTDNLSVKFYDTDQNEYMTPFSFFNYMQDIAWRNASQTNIGHERLSKQNMFWVVSRMKLIINETPKWSNNFQLTTRPKGADGAFALRDFIFEKNGKEIAHAYSYWLILKEDTLRPQRISEALKDVYEDEKDETFENLGKIIVSGQKIKTVTHIPQYSEIDRNKHVNNAFYAQWTSDIFDVDFLKTHILQEIQINYITAAKYGDNLEISLYEAEDGYYFVECFEMTKQNKIFQARVKWKNI